MPVSPFIRLSALLCALALANCAVNPVSGNPNFVTMSESQEVSIGRSEHKKVRQQYGIYDDAALQRYVSDIGQRLAKSSHRAGPQYQFLVVDSPEINAFALPGGYIYITRGILAYLNSEPELAAVLGHEIGHVTARHSVQQISAATAANVGASVLQILVPQVRNSAGDLLVNVLGGALLSGYGREHELEADRLGAEYLARTGYDPQAMIKVVGVLKNQELFDAEVAKAEDREPRASPVRRLGRLGRRAAQSLPGDAGGHRAGERRRRPPGTLGIACRGEWALRHAECGVGRRVAAAGPPGRAPRPAPGRA